MSCHQRDLVTLPPEQSAQHPLRVGRLALLRFGLLEGTRAGSGLPLLRGCLAGRRGRVFRFLAAEQRSEEHTSELQSLMRISYAVFCLKKKNILTILKYKL